MTLPFPGHARLGRLEEFPWEAETLPESIQVQTQGRCLPGKAWPGCRCVPWVLARRRGLEKDWLPQGEGGLGPMGFVVLFLCVFADPIQKDRSVL